MGQSSIFTYCLFVICLYIQSLKVKRPWEVSEISMDFEKTVSEGLKDKEEILIGGWK